MVRMQSRPAKGRRLDKQIHNVLLLSTTIREQSYFQIVPINGLRVLLRPQDLATLLIEKRRQTGSQNRKNSCYPARELTVPWQSMRYQGNGLNFVLVLFILPDIVPSSSARI
jgi:hypothetical protein